MSEPVPVAAPIHNLIAFGDTHCGSALGLCPPEGVSLDDGGVYQPSRLQQKLWCLWLEFWEWVDEATRGLPCCVVHMGDAIEGMHHGTTALVSSNLTDQTKIAYQILKPITEGAAMYYELRGSEAHVGPSAAQEELLAQSLGAVPNEDGQCARYELVKRVGPRLVHCLHHIGTTGSQAYESTAIHKEYIESLVDAARWGDDPMDVELRAHRHRYFKTEIATKNGSGYGVVCPGWQLKTGLAFRIAGGRVSEPQFGGVLIRWSPENDELFIRKWVRGLARSKPE
jgi:hypothetical protein